MLTVARDSEGRCVDIASLAIQKHRHIPLTPVYCLTCNRPLIPRLGAQRRHHFAHHATLDVSRCWATAPEGPLHLAAKAHLAAILERACANSQLLTAALPCPRCGAAEAVRIDVVQLSPSDRVLVEHWTDPRRALKPDLQVLGPLGHPILIVEVRVTHANSEAKLQLLSAAQTPMLEMDGERVVALEDASSALPTLSGLNLRSAEPCASCGAAQRRQDAKRAEQDAERAAQRVFLENVRAAVPQATAEARLALQRMARTHLVAAAHIDIYRDRTLRERRPLLVHATWQAELVTLELTERCGPSIRKWTGTQSEIATIYACDLFPAIHGFAAALASSRGQGANFDLHEDFPEGRYLVPRTFAPPAWHLEALWWPIFRNALKALLHQDPSLEHRLERLHFRFAYSSPDLATTPSSHEPEAL